MADIIRSSRDKVGGDVLEPVTHRRYRPFRAKQAVSHNPALRFEALEETVPHTRSEFAHDKVFVSDNDESHFAAAHCDIESPLFAS